MRNLLYIILFFQCVAAFAPLLDSIFDVHEKIEIVGEDSKENKELEDEKEKENEILNNIKVKKFGHDDLLLNYFKDRFQFNGLYVDINSPPPEK